MMISAVVLTKNEENKIVDCLESISFCDEIIVVDDYSEDRTIEIIKNYNDSGQARMTEKKIKFFQRHLDGDFAGQRNFGLKKAKGESFDATQDKWILFVDADERVTPELAREIKQKISNGFWTSQNDEENLDGFYIRRKDFLFGKWLKYGETKNIKFIRLIKKGCGRWERRVHEELGVLGKVGDLREPLLHYPHQTITEFLKEINFYTDLNAEELDSHFRGNDKWVGLSVLIYPLAKFMQNYFLKLGFLDGMAGFLQASFMSFHSFLTRGKLWEIYQRHSGPDVNRDPDFRRDLSRI